MKVPRGWLPLGLLLAAGGPALILGPLRAPAALAQTPTPAVAEGFNIAVVDYQSLLKNHPEFENLKQIDEQLGLLKEEKEWLPLKDAQEQRKSIYSKMEKEVEKAKEEMEAEKARLEGEMAGLSGSLQAQMNAELQRLQAGYNAEIEAKVKKLRPAQPQAQMPQPAAQSLSEYQQGLLLVRQRNVTARRLELEKAIRSEIEAERARFDQQQAAHEDQIAGQYQEEKLNLQLKLQVTQDEAEQQKLQDRLTAISEEISTKKAARRAELEAGFNSFRSQKNAEFESQLESYRRKMDAEVSAQVQGWRPTEKTTAPPAAPPPKLPTQEIEAKIAEARSAIKGQMAAKEAELRSAMQAKGEEARAKLIAKQAEIQKRLEETQEELKALFEEKKKNVSAKTKQKVEALTKQIDKLEKDREALYDGMIADLNKVVGEVAKKKDIPMVIGQVVYNRTCVDLTDFSMVGVKQLGSH